jgi:hypothetical protein
MHAATVIKLIKALPAALERQMTIIPETMLVNWWRAQMLLQSLVLVLVANAYSNFGLLRK